MSKGSAGGAVNSRPGRKSRRGRCADLVVPAKIDDFTCFSTRKLTAGSWRKRWSSAVWIWPIACCSNLSTSHSARDGTATRCPPTPGTTSIGHVGSEDSDDPARRRVIIEDAAEGRVQIRHDPQVQAGKQIGVYSYSSLLSLCHRVERIEQCHAAGPRSRL